MKVLILTDRMQGGGAETHIAQLSLGLRAAGNEVTILSAGGAYADALEKSGIRQLRAPISSHNPFRWIKLRRYHQRLVRKEKFDVLHAHARIPALLIRGAHRWGTAEIVAVHAHFYANAWLSMLCNWGTRTVAVSEDLRTYVSDTYGLPAERVCVIPNGIDCIRFSPPAPEDVRTVPRILFASRLDEDCSLGAELLCSLAPRLCRRYPGVRIEIAGGGGALPQIREAAEAVNQALGYTAVTVLGWVHNMSPIFRRNSIFVGVSRAAMEAAACGCAVILCGNEGYLGILNRANANEALRSNFCCRGGEMPNIDALQQDRVRLIESPSLRTDCGVDCRELIREHCSAERMCRETLALYHRALPHRTQLTITVGGYFGCGNTGDDAILLGFLTAIGQLSPKTRVIALTAAPYQNRRRFGIRCVNRKNPIAVRLSLLRSRAFLCGGGSLLQNGTSIRSLSYYLGLLRLAARLRVTCVLYAAGIGPLIGKSARLRTLQALSRCRYISLRDEHSFRYLSAHGTDMSLLHLGADPAFLMPPPPSGRAVSILREFGVPTEQRYLCVVLRGGTSAALPRSILLTAVRMLCHKNSLFPLFPVFDEHLDREVTHRAAEEIGGRMILLREPADATALLSICEVGISMRLHALILATSVATPMIGISADPQDNKIAAFAKSAGQDFIAPEHLTVAELVEKSELTIAERSSRRPILLDCADRMRKKAQKDLANIIEMIYNISKQ